MNSRKDYLQSSQESFVYDALNRLKTTTTQYRLGTQTLSRAKSNDYDGHGNLIHKEGITSTYGSDGLAPSKVHQLNSAQVTANLNLLFVYDKNGNAEHIGDNRRLYWNSFNKVERITKGSELSNFYYNADHQRILQDATKGNYWYAGEGSFERLWDRSDSRETYKYQLRVGDRSVGYLRQTYYPTGSSTEQRFYTLTDHLGSIQAVIGADGRKLQSLSFSAWGERRAADWNPSGIATPALDLVRNYGLTHGFTGHEADEPWGLVNMKGRLYDPIVGRFLSADPLMQFAHHTQGYNRYTYVLNNPLSFTDPSGYFLSGLVSFLRGGGGGWCFGCFHDHLDRQWIDRSSLEGRGIWSAVSRVSFFCGAWRNRSSGGQTRRCLSCSRCGSRGGLGLAGG